MIDPEGNMFEKVAIEAWIQKNRSLPITHTLLSKEDLYENRAIPALLDEETRKNMSDIHPPIRRSVEEAPPESPPVSSDQGESQTHVFVLPTILEEIELRRQSTQRD